MTTFLNQVICGNSLDILKTIPDDSINLIVTSPPYFGCRVYGGQTEGLGREANPLDYIKNLTEFTNELKRILHPQGTLYLNIGDVYFGTKGFSRNSGKYKRKTDHHYKTHKICKTDGKYLQHKQLLLLPSRVAIEMQNNGWLLRNDLIWEKLRPIPSHSPDRRLPVYEHIFHFAKSRKYYFDYKKAKDFDSHRDVIRCDIEPYKEHQASFPEKLITPLILTASKKGDTVLDPFGGSGTVGAVCVKHGRNYILIEKIEEYCKMAENRIDEITRVGIHEENVEGEVKLVSNLFV